MSDGKHFAALDQRLEQSATLFEKGQYAEALTFAHAVRWDDSANAELQLRAQAAMDRIFEQCLSGKCSRSEVPEAYHRWYYDNLVWMTTRYLGLPIWKSPSDMWNYQEIISELRPALVIEFGTYSGASALFFSNTMTALGLAARVLTVDVDPAPINARIVEELTIEVMTCSSTDAAVARRIADLRIQYPGPVFAILDSDHRKEHVLGEMMLLRPLLAPGDYLVVEDSNINGHPVMPDWGPGPFEAIVAYECLFSADYQHDFVREQKFGFTFATHGFLRRL